MEGDFVADFALSSSIHASTKLFFVLHDTVHHDDVFRCQVLFQSRAHRKSNLFGVAKLTGPV